MKYPELLLVEIKYIMFLFYYTKYMDKEKELIIKNTKILNNAIVLFNKQRAVHNNMNKNGGDITNNNLLINTNNIINLGNIQLDTNNSINKSQNSTMTLNNAKNDCLHRFFNSKKN
jgi:hypothetical protein